MGSPEINLLMVHADDHAPLLEEGLDGSAASHQEAPDVEHSAESYWEEGGDPNDLYEQRWGVIAPEGPEGDRLLQRIEPLIRLRQEAQEGEPIRIYRVPESLTFDQAARWKKQEFDAGEDMMVDLPRYQLILGDLDQVPLSVQQVLATDGFVGRLAFSHDEGYESYVDKVLRWEREPSEKEVGDALFYTVHDGTPATSVGHRALMEPGVELVQRPLRWSAEW